MKINNKRCRRRLIYPSLPLIAARINNEKNEKMQKPSAKKHGSVDRREKKASSKLADYYSCQLMRWSANLYLLA